MTMKIKLNTLLESFGALQAIANQPFPVKLSYKLGRILKAAEQCLQAHEKVRVKLVEKYGEKREKGGYEVTDPEALEKFKAEVEPLLEVEQELWGDPISIYELGNKELPPAVLGALDWLIVEETPVDLAISQKAARRIQ